ncbi:MAG: DUF3604 domain-containing protein [Deltaproteobacteria bacterium]|jgi:hypothetical protein|nr:DUF3604 domain-containing protein [Deltaproteobacteria bacterium]MBW2499272.1 DUF3604 domain-containing protein [Deltaproteobacteria bacterium]
MHRIAGYSLLILAGLLMASAVHAQADIAPGREDLPEKEKLYSPYVERAQAGSNFAEGVYWGDTHLHTGYSTDAGMIGTTLTPEDAYRFARGEEVTSSTGQRARLVRPLDFLVVADHAENLGLAPMIAESNRDLLQAEYGRKLHDLVKAGEGYEAFRTWGMEGVAKNKDIIGSRKMQRTIWDRQIETADAFNQPGVFTALIGFEWTSINNMKNPSNLHRVVIFKEDSRKAGQVLPFSTFDSEDPEDLWKYMQNYEDKTGGSVLAIPHNGNLSNGLMFAVERLNGRRINRKYAEARMRWEPLYEVTQIKGDGEAHPKLSPNDEFADYGTWDKADIAGLKPKTDEMLPHEYARSALQIGLQQQRRLGINPFKFGMIGSTDAHTGLASTRDENYWGKMITSEPGPERMDHYVIQALSGDEALSTFSWEEVASGLAAVWARDNTRASIFEAMQKKEAYATTGTRIVVRFFGGWDYAPEDVFRPTVGQIGYDKGVPMGGDLPKRKEDKAPIFMIGAMKDPWSGNLDRIQIVKGWVDGDGERHEKVYDVACADRELAHGKCAGPIGSTVDVEKATYLNTIGDAELRATWIDPDFDPEHPAVYYARVLEIPTPTWQAIDAAFYGVDTRPEVPLQHQERAYTSPIWYTP